ncbi:MAG: hypothetical protein V3R24_10775 [Gemmatimonadales bacterium]
MNAPTRLLAKATLIALLVLPIRVAAQVSPTDTTGMPPAGHGTLGQDNISIRLEASAISLQMYPLNEVIIRLLSPDTYRSLHRLLESHQEAIDEASRSYALAEPGIFVVTFFGREVSARFDPDEVTITSQNRFFRPVAIIPLSPIWNQHELGRRETAAAIYVYEDGIRLLEPFSIEYKGTRINQWQALLSRIEEELARVRTRAVDPDS